MRPIKPEDEPLVQAMFHNLHEQTKRHRFFETMGEISPEIAGRYCNVDYEKEIALVAELAEDTGRKIVGTAQLFTDASGKSGEITLVVADPWQGMGLGTKLLNNIVEICKDKNLNTVYGKMRSNNNSTIEFAKKQGFTIENLNPNIVRASREIKG